MIAAALKGVWKSIVKSKLLVSSFGEIYSGIRDQREMEILTTVVLIRSVATVSNSVAELGSLDAGTVGTFVLVQASIFPRWLEIVSRLHE